MRNPFKRKAPETKSVKSEDNERSFQIVIHGGYNINEPETEVWFEKCVVKSNTNPVVPLMPDMLYTWAAQFLMNVVDELNKTKKVDVDPDIKPS